MTELEEYYNKFNEDKRLRSRHGRVEFITTMKYIHQALFELNREAQDIKILDVGAGTGGYSIPFAEEGYDVTAVELVKHNLGILKSHSDKVKAYQGNALRLKRFDSESFDVTLLLGPMYHLHSMEEKKQALAEAARVTKIGGTIIVAYIMNEYSVITYAFKERNIRRALQEGLLTEDYHCTKEANPLYSFVRIEDIDEVLSSASNLERIKLVSADGAANYIRQYLNALDEDEFEEFIKYHLATCERADTMGAAGHTIDVIRKK